ncbi:hypothetical protein SCLARK_00939 [Spiroplasma clarkii]|uniref:hypothetical protein n=1 Tax=Spiroplasma clarkii TaxID=2139 RepID=UPI000B561B18|nr:hypothetical protein [Spiroplasma clarkii]ARU91547.1 hypothetical protein SCLARK_00939 [Spiroplasma clarkii]
MGKYDINIKKEWLIAGEYWNINIEDVNKIVRHFPYAFAFATNDVECCLESDEFIDKIDIDIEMQSNSKFNKEIIGVFDSYCDLPSSWLEHAVISSEKLIPISKNRDTAHGTQVAS